MGSNKKNIDDGSLSHDLHQRLIQVFDMMGGVPAIAKDYDLNYQTIYSWYQGRRQPEVYTQWLLRHKTFQVTGDFYTNFDAFGAI